MKALTQGSSTPCAGPKQSGEPTALTPLVTTTSHFPLYDLFPRGLWEPGFRASAHLCLQVGAISINEPLFALLQTPVCFFIGLRFAQANEPLQFGNKNGLDLRV